MKWSQHRNATLSWNWREWDFPSSSSSSLAQQQQHNTTCQVNPANLSRYCRREIEIFLIIRSAIDVVHLSTQLFLSFFTFHQQFYTSSLSVGAEHAVADTREFQISIDDFFFIIFARRSQTHTVQSAGKRRMSNRVNTDAMWKNCLISNKLRRRDRGGWQRQQLTWKDEKIFINSKLNSFIWNFPYDEYVHGNVLLCTMAHLNKKKSTKAHERADQQQKGTKMTWKWREISRWNWKFCLVLMLLVLVVSAYTGLQFFSIHEIKNLFKAKRGKNASFTLAGWLSFEKLLNIHCAMLWKKRKFLYFFMRFSLNFH